MSQKILIFNARLSFSALFKAKAKKSGQGAPKHKANFILSEESSIKTPDGKLHKGVKAIREAMAKVGKAVMEEKFSTAPAKFTNWAIRDGDDVINDSTGEHWDGYGPGVFFIVASSGEDRKPKIVGLNPNFDLKQEDNAIKDGDFVNGRVSVYAYDAKADGGGKGVTASLEVVQFAVTGDAFGEESAPAADDFEDLSGSDEAAEEITGL